MCGCNMRRFWVILVMLLTREFCSYFFLFFWIVSMGTFLSQEETGF